MTIISFQDSIEWYKDSLQGPILLKTDDNNFFHKVTTYSNDLSFGKEVTFESISLVDKGRYICRVKEKGSAYHHQPGENILIIFQPQLYYRGQFHHRFMRAFFCTKFCSKPDSKQLKAAKQTFV